MTSSGINARTGLLPLLKWPGGKRMLVRHLVQLVPSEIGRYYEPFLGGGALFFALCPKSALLTDNNQELINCYVQVRNQPHAVISCLAQMKNTEQDYYAIRENVPVDEVGRAGRLIYLATLSFNGIHRVNLKGQFNVPYGRKAHLSPCEPERILAASTALASAQLLACDFEEATNDAGAGDFIYLDPPYTVAHGINGFLKYNAKVFSWPDQERLARVARQLVERGCRVVVSNADHPSIHALYGGFKVQRISRHSVIAASDSHRRLVTECVFYNQEEG